MRAADCLPGCFELIDVLGQSPRPCHAAGSGSDEDRRKKEAEDPRLHVIPDRIPKESDVGNQGLGRRDSPLSFGCRIT